MRTPLRSQWRASIQRALSRTSSGNKTVLNRRTRRKTPLVSVHAWPGRLNRAGRARKATAKPWLQAWRGNRYKRAALRISRKPDCLPHGPRWRGPAESRQQRRLSSAQPRSVAPVFFVTSVTILATVASISASVRVRSLGCNVTVTATDLCPSGIPCPR